MLCAQYTLLHLNPSVLTTALPVYIGLASGSTRRAFAFLQDDADALRLFCPSIIYFNNGISHSYWPCEW